MTADGEKLRLVRLAMGIQQKEMADVLGIPQPNLSEMESSIRPVPEHVIVSLHFITGFSSAFFSKPISSDVPPGSEVWYRKKQDKYRKSAGSQAYCQLVLDTFEPLTKELKPRQPKLSRVTDCTYDEAAQQVRNALGVRMDAPISNITYLAENAGVRVIGIGQPILPSSIADVASQSAPEFEAFSFWSKDDVPVAFVRTDIPADRMNWALAHELIHLVMHSSYQGKTRTAEEEAQRGTSELLMPASVISDSFGGPHSVTRLCALSARWNVSLFSLVIRATELGLMTDANKRYYIGAVRKGAGESVHVRTQKPRFYRQMCEVLLGKPILLTPLARRTGASKRFLYDVLSAHGGLAEDLEDPTPSPSE